MTSATGANSRRQRIDFFRLVAIAFIVELHVQTMGDVSHASFVEKAAQLAIVLGARYAIPLFFIFAGYFVGGEISQEPSRATSIAYTYTKRLAIALLFWCAIYALEDPRAFLSLAQNQPVTLIFQGSKVHLWFLVSLILTVWLYVLWPDRKNMWSFLLLGGILFAIGLLAGSYSGTPIGFDLHFNTRNGVFFSTLFFGLGVAFRRKMPRVSRQMALGMAAVGLVLSCVEAFWLLIRWGLSPLGFDYLLGTIPFGIGVSLLALTQPDSPLDRRMGPYGRYVLGVYASHVLFIDLLRPLAAFVQPLVWQLIFPVTVIALSLTITIILAKTPLRPVVM